MLGGVAKTPLQGTNEERIAPIADLQRGYAARRQILTAGLTSAAIGRLVRRSYLIVVHPGTYAVGHHGDVHLGPETAALLAVRDGAALSHFTASILWGIEKPDAAGVQEPIHLTVPGSPGGHPDGVLVHRSTIFEPQDLRIHQRLPITSPARTLLDRAAEISGRTLELAVNQALVHRLTSLPTLHQLLKRSGRHHGRTPLQDIIDAHTHPTATQSDNEERLLALIRQAGLPDPHVNYRIAGMRVDFAWPEHGLVVEVDGPPYHSTNYAINNDRQREMRLRAAGWTVIRFSADQVHHDALRVIGDIAMHLNGRPRTADR